MPKLRKLRRKQKFQFNRNRQRVRKTQEKTRNSNVVVNCDVLKANWDARKPVKQNMSEMGLAFDANQITSLQSTKQELIKRAKGDLPKKDEEGEVVAGDVDSKVVSRLTEEASEAEEAAKRPRFRFSREEARWIAGMMDRHGDDFKAMSRDPKNHYQLTPKQIRQKVVKFVQIPEQFAHFAKKRGLLAEDAVKELAATAAAEK